MLQTLRDYLAHKPILFSYLRMIIELNFYKQKRIIRNTIIKNSGGKKILDIGCGTGAFADIFNKDNYYGIDIYPEYIEYAKKNSKGNFQVMDATRLKFPNEHFDRILIMAILQHLTDEDSDKLIREAVRVLKPNGQILIMEDSKIPHLDNMATRLVQKFDKGEFIRTPEDYKKIAAPHLNIVKEEKFRSGICSYYAMLLKK